MLFKFLYIGSLSKGSTSKMRYNSLKKIFNHYTFDELDTEKIVSDTNRIFRTLAFRFKKGPLIKRINKEVNILTKQNYDIVWVDKGIFIDPNILKFFKPSAKLIHYTPDAAFHIHNSIFFNRCIHLYDYCITTKSFEIDLYKKHGAKEVFFCTQAYDKQQHFAMHSFNEKKGIAFIGRWEKERENVIKKLLAINIDIKLAGNGWKNFIKKNKNKPHLTYYGKGIYHDEYRKLISSAKMAIGFLSELLPELHTTRTFEIPACGTALITKKNEETAKYFNDNEAIFYADTTQLVEKVKYYFDNPELLKEISENGHRRVVNGNYSYDQILEEFQKLISK